MSQFNLFNISQSERNALCERVIGSSAPRFDFYFLVILSTLIVTLGIIGDNIVLVIGGMLVTPLLSPVLAISLGLVIRNLKVIIRSFRIFLIAFLLACLVSFMVAFFTEFNINEISILNNLKPSVYTFIVAVVAGLAAGFTWAKPSLSDTLPGIAITVTLIPPITSIGIALAVSDWNFINTAFLVLVINVAGILLASTVLFVIMQFYRSKKKLIAEIKEEEKALRK